MSDNPYAPTDAVNIRQVKKLSIYKPLSGLATAITVSLGLFCLLTVVVLMFETYGLTMFASYSDPNAELESELERTILLSALGFSVVNVVAYFTTVVFVCIFMYRANANVRFFGATHLEITPGWCAGWWFIPFMNLFKPYVALKEIYRVSQRPVARDWKIKTASAIFPLWWASWLLGCFTSRIESRLAMRGEDIGEMALPLTWVVSLSLITSGLLLVVITRKISQFQTDWHLKTDQHVY